MKQLIEVCIIYPITPGAEKQEEMFADAPAAKQGAAMLTGGGQPAPPPGGDAEMAESGANL